MDTQNSKLDARRKSVEPSLHSLPRSHHSEESKVSANKLGYPPTTTLDSSATTANGAAEKSSDTLPALTSKQKLTARIQFVALCWTLFVAGWNDGTTGPLLPRIQEVYGVRHNFFSADLIS